MNSIPVHRHTVEAAIAACAVQAQHHKTAAELRLALEAGAAQGWQPIGTAPRDNSWILGLTQAKRQVVVRWGGGAWEDDNRLCRDPWYWQPLSAPPAASAQQEG